MDAGQVFGIIFALIFLAFFLIFGLDQLKDFFCIGSDAQVAKQVKDLEVIVEDLYTKTEGSSVSVDLRLPGDGSICFLNPSNYGRNIDYGWNPQPTVIREILENPNHEDYNASIWIRKCGGEEAYKISNLRSDINFCVGKGKEIFLENRGFFVQVSLTSG